jgi:hypothetical protein
LTFNGGNIGVASQVFNDGNSMGSRVIEVTPATEPQSYIIVNNDGTFNVYYKSPSLGIVQSFISGPTPDAQYGFGFQVSNGLAVFASTMLDGNAGTPIRTDGNGNITSGQSIYVNHLKANAPVTLAPGNQATGLLYIQVDAVSGRNYGHEVNFPVTMTNTPTSTNITGVSQSGIGSAGTFGFTLHGMFFQVTANATANVLYQATYTTVGNCLLAVDAQARTFDHHCDGCGAVRRGIALGETLHQVCAGGHHLLTYTCPACGAVESFNCALSAADEADTAPQGSGEFTTTRGAQATLIRALMGALGLAVTP